MADTKLNIIISAKDAASSVFTGIGAKMKGLTGGGIGSIGAGAGSAFAGVAARMAALAGGMLSVGAAAKVMHDSVDKAAEFEGIQTSFVTLLGSTDAAKKRMEELSKFAASTPFDIPGVARASKTLETLTRGALSTGKGLTLVGDVAASSGVKFDDMAVTIGRAYDGLQSGRAIGESLMRLQELGAVSGDTRGEIEKLQAAGMKGEAVWSVLEKSLGKFGGEMTRQSGTFSGKMSNMKDSWDSLQRAFGEPVIDALKPLLDDLGAWFEKLKPAAVEFGQTVAGAIELLRKAFADGSMWGKLGDTMLIVFTNAAGFLENALKMAFRVALASLWAGIQAAGDQLGELISGGDVSADSFMAAFEREVGKSTVDLNPPSAADWLAATKRQLKDVWGELPAIAAKPNVDANKQEQGGASSATGDGKIAKAETDSLAKVGLFAGGSAPALNYARRTADGIDRVAKGIDKLVKQTPPASPTASWA